VLIMANRRGFTLIEIMVSLVVLLIVSAAVYRMLITTQRLSRAQSEWVSLQSNVRTGSLIVPNELREASTVEGADRDHNDLQTIEADNITYRAMRGLGFVCQVPPAAGTELRIAGLSYSGYRDPVGDGRDSLMLFLEGDPDDISDDLWAPLRIAGLAASPNSCGAGVAGYTITLVAGNKAAAEIALGSVSVNTPVRIYEVMELRLYQQDGRSWLGAHSMSAPGGEATQPVLGPLTDGNGFALVYLDQNNNVTGDRTRVKSVRVTINGITDEAINAGGGSGALTHPEQHLITQVTLRNGFRP
jgi:prepilin-type N-terminal cleavage/methylation domain-containing protein